MAEEGVEPRGRCGVYHQHPLNEKVVFGDNGLNTGTYLVSSANMKRADFVTWMSSAESEYRGSLRFPDQDLVDILQGAPRAVRHAAMQCQRAHRLGLRRREVAAYSASWQ